jgi:hypothetical protein
MNPDCVPYRRKSLYLLLTIPMIGLYVVLAAMLWQASVIAFVAYCALFVVVALCQSYVCVYWQCPYVGRFAPCVGGFCLPSSQIARLFTYTARSERVYNTVVSAAFAGFLGIIVLPVYFLYRQDLVFLLAYLGIVLVYAALFLWFICAVCATRQRCPGGQASSRLREMFRRR